jgi:putative ABC transport system permease protein
MVSALDKKLLRDLARLRGQLVTIALVVACGIASFVAMQSTWTSLHHSQAIYYERYRFADVFAHLKRAPDTVAERIAEIPGVAQTYHRVVEPVMLPLEDSPEPASGSLVSIPDDDVPALNGVYVRDGQLPGRGDEVLLLQSFADAHAMKPGDRLPAVINGTLRELRIAGTALSPEFVFAVPPGDITVDEKRFAVLWMHESSLAPAYQMQSAFNDVCLRLQPGTDERAVTERLDTLLAPYGGTGAITKDKQFSNFSLNGEMQQLESMATVVPTIFLGVAAFLLNVVLARLVSLQRPEIAALKALGYRDGQIALFYLKLVALIVIMGAAVGLGIGVWFGRAMVEMYTRFFKFPMLTYRLEMQHVAIALLISLLAAVIGALATARSVTRMPPAEAMRPPPPASYRPTVLERLGLFGLLGPATRMIMREIERRPIRTLLSAIGIAFAVAIVVVGQFWNDSTDFLIQVQFHRAMREDLSVTFIEPRPERSIRELAHVPGVLYAEGARMVPVRFRSGHRFRDSVLWGYPDKPELRHILDQFANSKSLPRHGVLLTKKLGEVLGVGTGDRVEIDIREGDRRTVELEVADLVDESFGLQGYMQLDAIHELLREEPNVSMALLSIDPTQYDEVHRRIKAMRAVASVTRRDNVSDRFQEQSGDMMKIMTFVLTLFAAIIAVGVVYNNARVALEMRSRDLASLRVLGFTRAEIGSILVGELSVQILAAIPLGLVIGTWLSRAMMSAVDPETYRFPVIISNQTYAFATVVALGSGFVSALLVRHRLNRLDLIGVLKTRE